MTTIAVPPLTEVKKKKSEAAAASTATASVTSRQGIETHATKPKEDVPIVEPVNTEESPQTSIIEEDKGADQKLDTQPKPRPQLSDEERVQRDALLIVTRKALDNSHMGRDALREYE